MRQLLFLAPLMSIHTVEKKYSVLSRLCGFAVTEKKLQRYVSNGMYYADEYVSLKLKALFPERIELQAFVKKHGTIEPVILTDEFNFDE